MDSTLRSGDDRENHRRGTVDSENNHPQDAMEGHPEVIGRFFCGIEQMVNDFECTDSSDRSGFSSVLFLNSFDWLFALRVTAT
jgi:hypothetical protein